MHLLAESIIINNGRDLSLKIPLINLYGRELIIWFLSSQISERIYLLITFSAYY